MFCTKCGSEIAEGAKFCTVCGAQVKFAQVPAPGAPEAQAPAPAAPAAGTPVWTAPAAPAAPATPAAPAQPAAGQTNAWQQPAQPQQPAWQQPAQPTQPQQPAQWQQIQQQWNQQQAQQRQQPQAQWQQQPNWQPPAPAAAKKKGKGGLIAGIIAGVLVVCVGVGGFVWPGFFKKGGSDGSGAGGGSGSGGSGGGISTALAQKFASPEEYFQVVEQDNVEALAGHIASAYDNLFLSNASSDDISLAGAVSFEPGDRIRSLLVDTLSEQLDEINPGDDLGWFKSVTLDYDVSKKDTAGSVNAGVKINGTDLVHINAFLRSDDGTVCLGVPELSDRYFQTTLEDLNLDGLTSGLSLGALAGSLNAEDAEKIDPVIDALPDAKLVETLLVKYLKEAVELVEDVKKEQGTLAVEDVSADYTVLTSTVDPDTAIKIVQKLGPELKEDKDLHDIITGVAAAAGEDPEAKYKEFTDKIDEYLNDPEKIREDMKSDYVFTVYLDGSSTVHGRVIDTGDKRIELLMPEKGGRFGLAVCYTDEGTEKLNIIGSGKRSGDKLTGDLSVDVDGEYYGIVGLDGFDIEKAKDGYFVGGLTLKPTPSVWTKLLEKINENKDEDDKTELPETLRSILDTLVVHLDLDVGKDKNSVKADVSTTAGEQLFTIAFSGTKGSAKSITPVEGVEPSEWTEDVTLDKLEKVVASLEKAGIPAAYTDTIDAALDDSFS